MRKNLRPTFTILPSFLPIPFLPSFLPSIPPFPPLLFCIEGTRGKFSGRTRRRAAAVGMYEEEDEEEEEEEEEEADA